MFIDNTSVHVSSVLKYSTEFGILKCKQAKEQQWNKERIKKIKKETSKYKIAHENQVNQSPLEKKH